MGKTIVNLGGVHSAEQRLAVAKRLLAMVGSVDYYNILVLKTL